MADSPLWKTRLVVWSVLTAAIGAAAIIVPKRMAERTAARYRTAPIALDVACVGVPAGSLAACPQGATLQFSVLSALPGTAYLTAYADPQPSGERIWYFSADGESPSLPASPSNDKKTFDKTIRLGPEHAAGDYRISLLVSTRPLTKSTVSSGLAALDLVTQYDVKGSTRQLPLHIVEAPK